MGQRCLLLPDGCQLDVQMEALVPDVDIETWRAGAKALLASGALLVFGTLWADIGFMALFFALVLRCPSIPLLVCTVFVSLRVGFAAAVLRRLHEGFEALERHRSRGHLMGGGSQLPIYAHAEAAVLVR